MQCNKKNSKNFTSQGDIYEIRSNKNTVGLYGEEDTVNSSDLHSHGERA